MKKKKWLAYLILVAVLLAAGCAEGTFEIHTQADPGEGGSVTGGGTYSSGEAVLLTAEPAQGYVFINWTEEGEAVSADPSIELTVERDKNFTANFAKIEDIIDIGFDLDQLVLKEGYEAANWPFDRIQETVEKALKVYDRQSQGELAAGIFEGEANTELEKGNLTLNIPALGNFIDALEVHFEKLVVSKEEIEVHTLVKYPHIEEEAYDGIAQELEEAVMAGAAERAINLEEKFAQVLALQDLSQKETAKKLVLAKGEEGLVVTYIDEPEELFASFDHLFTVAVSEHITAVIVEANANNIVADLSENPARAEFKGATIPVENLIPYYLADKVTFILADETEIRLEQIWQQLIQKEDAYVPMLGFQPDSFLYHISFRESSPQGKIPFYLTRPYAVLTMDAAVGYVNEKREEARIIEVIHGPGESAGDFYWSPDEDYAAYSWVASGSGFTFLHVYNVEEDEIISFTELKGVDPQEGFTGVFTELQWTEDGKTLHVKVQELTDPELDEEDGEVTSWALDVVERELSQLE